MQLILVESPFAFKHEDEVQRRIGLLRNVTYARCALNDCFTRGEAPYASHLLFTQPFVLDDDVEHERQLGIDAGLHWGLKAEATALYTDLGMSNGMLYGVKNAAAVGRPVEHRTLDGWQNAFSEEPSETLIRLGFYERDALARLADADNVTAAAFAA